MTSEAELIGGSGESDVCRPLDAGDRVTDGAAHRHGSVDIFSCCLVLVARETLGGIDIGWKKNRMLMEVSTRRK